MSWLSVLQATQMSCQTLPEWFGMGTQVAYMVAYRQRPEVRARRRANYDSRQRFLAAVKQTEGCNWCGYSGHPAALDFDHREDKTGTLSRMQHHAFPTMLEEVMKCDVLCANCHRIKTMKERTNGL